MKIIDVLNERKIGMLLSLLLILSCNLHSQNKNDNPLLDSLVVSATHKVSKQDMKGALNDCNEALKINPKITELLLLRAGIKEYLKDSKGAMEDYNEAVKINPDYIAAYENRSKLEQLNGDKKAALADMKKAYSLDSANPFTLNNIAKLEIESGNNKDGPNDFRRAVQLFNSKIKETPNDGNLYFNRAIAEYFLNQDDLYCNDFKKAKDLGIHQADEYMRRYCK
jgi:tetratricopeptide (TPR) repeat protein